VINAVTVQVDFRQFDFSGYDLSGVGLGLSAKTWICGSVGRCRVNQPSSQDSHDCHDDFCVPELCRDALTQ
jgi:hypothetical protein